MRLVAGLLVAAVLASTVFGGQLINQENRWLSNIREPNEPPVKPRAFVTVYLMQDEKIPDVRVAQGDNLLFKNTNDHRTYVLNSKDMSNFQSPHIYPYVNGLENNGRLRTSYRYFVTQTPGNYSYYEEGTGQTACIEVIAGHKQPTHFFAGKQHVNDKKK